MHRGRFAGSVYDHDARRLAAREHECRPRKLDGIPARLGCSLQHVAETAGRITRGRIRLYEESKAAHRTRRARAESLGRHGNAEDETVHAGEHVLVRIAVIAHARKVDDVSSVGGRQFYRVIRQVAVEIQPPGWSGDHTIETASPMPIDSVTAIRRCAGL